MTIRPTHLTLGLAFLTACGAPSTATDAADVPVLALSASPTLEIGVVEGALGYGYSVPPGWVPGGVLCGPPAATATHGGG